MLHDWGHEKNDVQTYADIMDRFNVRQDGMTLSFRTSQIAPKVWLPRWLKLAAIGAIVLVIIDKVNF